MFPHPDLSDLPDRSLDVMSAVTQCHVPQTVTSDVPSTLICYIFTLTLETSELHFVVQLADISNLLHY